MFKHISTIVAPILAFVTYAAAADTAPTDGTTNSEPALLRQVREAYQNTLQYQATVQFSAEQAQGRVTRITRMDFLIVFDRPTQRLVIDKPDMRVVVSDGKFNMVSEQVKGHHLEADLNGPMSDWNNMVAVMAYAFDPALPDVALLVAENPVAALSRPGNATVKTGDEPDTLVIEGDDGPMTLHIDPATHLIDHAVVAFPGGGQKTTLVYDFKIEKHNEAIDPAVFKFEPGNSTSYKTFGDLQAGLVKARGGQGGGGAPVHALQDKPAPAITAKTAAGEAFTLQDVDADIVVLDFWATWCGPCVEGLPHVQAISDWAKKNNMPVAVYTVNVQETAQEANDFWKSKKFTMPIVLDTDGAISEAYAVQGIPQTVVIVKGTVKGVHVGYSPTMEDDLKSEIESAVKELKPDPAADPAMQ